VHDKDGGIIQTRIAVHETEGGTAKTVTERGTGGDTHEADPGTITGDGGLGRGHKTEIERGEGIGRGAMTGV
jgi:hypothetical protein